MDGVKKRGKRPLPPDRARTHRVSVSFDPQEWASVEARRGGMSRAAWLRAAALAQLPHQVPAINRQAYAELARTAANLNQISRRLNAGDAVQVDEVSAALAALRREIMGVKS